MGRKRDENEEAWTEEERESETGGYAEERGKRRKVEHTETVAGDDGRRYEFTGLCELRPDVLSPLPHRVQHPNHSLIPLTKGNTLFMPTLRRLNGLFDSPLFSPARSRD